MVRKIKCKRCGACAKTTRGINLTADELRRIRGKVPLVETKSAKFAGKIPVDKHGFCVALESDRGKSRCKIYRIRPGKCKQYPIIYFGGRAIIQSDCKAVKDLLAEGRRCLEREEIEKIPFLAKSLKALEQGFPQVKKQKLFDITNA